MDLNVPVPKQKLVKHLQSCETKFRDVFSQLELFGPAGNDLGE